MEEKEGGGYDYQQVEVESDAAYVSAHLFVFGNNPLKLPSSLKASLKEKYDIEWPDAEAKNVWFKTGWNPNDMDTKRSDFSKQTGRTLARAARALVEELVADLPDQTILTCTPEYKDGLESKREKAFARVGFTWVGSVMAATVRDGKIVPISEYVKAQRRDSRFVPDWEGFAEDLARLPEFGGAGADLDREDSIEACFSRLGGLLERLQGAAA
jgi:hypothetical protein